MTPNRDLSEKIKGNGKTGTAGTGQQAAFETRPNGSRGRWKAVLNTEQENAPPDRAKPGEALKWARELLVVQIKSSLVTLTIDIINGKPAAWQSP